METSDEEAWLLLRPNSKTDSLQQLLRKRELIVALLKAQENLIRDAQQSIQEAAVSRQQGQPHHAHHSSQPVVISEPAVPLPPTSQHNQQVGCSVTSTSHIPCGQASNYIKPLGDEVCAKQPPVIPSSQKEQGASAIVKNVSNKVREDVTIILPPPPDAIPPIEPVSVPCSPYQDDSFHQPPAIQGQGNSWEHQQQANHTFDDSLPPPVTELPYAMPDFTPPHKRRRHSHHHHHHHKHHNHQNYHGHMQHTGQCSGKVDGELPRSSACTLMVHPTYDETLEIVPATPCSPSPARSPIKTLVSPDHQQTRQTLFVGSNQRLKLATSDTQAPVAQTHPMSHQHPCCPTNLLHHNTLSKDPDQQVAHDQHHMHSTNHHTGPQLPHVQPGLPQVPDSNQQHQDDRDTGWRRKSTRKRNKTAAMSSANVETDTSHTYVHSKPDMHPLQNIKHSQENLRQTSADVISQMQGQVQCSIKDAEHQNDDQQCLQPVPHLENIHPRLHLQPDGSILLQTADADYDPTAPHTGIVGVQLPAFSHSLEQPHQHAIQPVGMPFALRSPSDCMPQHQPVGGSFQACEGEFLRQPTVQCPSDDVPTQQLSDLTLQGHITCKPKPDTMDAVRTDGDDVIRQGVGEGHSLDIQEFTLPGIATALCASECGNFLAALIQLQAQTACHLKAGHQNGAQDASEPQGDYELRLFHTFGSETSNETTEEMGLTTVPELKEAACAPLQIRSTLGSKEGNLRCPVALIQPQMSDCMYDAYQDLDHGIKFDALGMPHDRMQQNNCDPHTHLALQGRSTQYDQMPVIALCSALAAADSTSMDSCQLQLITWVPPEGNSSDNCCQQCLSRGLHQGIAKVVCDKLAVGCEHAQGHWKQLQPLQSQAVMYSVLQLDNTTLVAAGEAGHASLWTLRFASTPSSSQHGSAAPRVMLDTAEFYRLPQARIAGAALQDIVQLQVLPTSPHVVMGSTDNGSFALWDTHRRQCLIAQHHPTPLTHQIVPVNFMYAGVHDSDTLQDQQQPNPALKSPEMCAHTPIMKCKLLGASSQKHGIHLQPNGIQQFAATPCQTTKIDIGSDGCGWQTSIAGYGNHAAGVSRLGRASGGVECQTDGKPSAKRGGSGGCIGVYQAPTLPQTIGNAAQTPQPAFVTRQQQQPQTVSATYSAGRNKELVTTPYTTRASSAIRKGVVVQWQDEILSADHPLILISVASSTKAVCEHPTARTIQQGTEANDCQHLCACSDVQQEGSMVQDVMQISVVSLSSAAICSDICRPPHPTLSIAALSRLLLVISDADMTLVDSQHGGNVWQVQLDQLLNDHPEHHDKQQQDARQMMQHGSEIDMHTLTASRSMIGHTACKPHINNPPSVLFLNDHRVCVAVNSKVMCFAW